MSEELEFLETFEEETIMDLTNKLLLKSSSNQDYSGLNVTPVFDCPTLFLDDDGHGELQIFNTTPYSFSNLKIIPKNFKGSFEVVKYLSSMKKKTIKIYLDLPESVEPTDILMELQAECSP